MQFIFTEAAGYRINRYICTLMFRSDLSQSLIYMEFAMLAKKCISITGFDFSVALLL